MKNVKTPFELRKGVGIAISMGFGAAMGLIINVIGEYHGRKKSNEDWEAALDEVIEQSKNKPEEGEKEE